MIGLVGISHNTAPVSLREQFAFSNDEIKKFGELLKIDLRIQGCVILSTCNRTEIYFHISIGKEDMKIGFDFILRNLAYFKNYTDTQKQFFYFKHDEGAIQHLFKVACGLDSLVIGEDQIISQVKDALQISHTNKLINNYLSRIFQKAIEAGKRVRTETNINKGCSSVSSVAIELIESVMGNISQYKSLFIGTGQTGELAIRSLLKKGGKELYISNRTFSKAQKLAQAYQGQAISFEYIETILPDIDIIITATNANTYIINPEMVEKAMHSRKEQKQIYIDLSVPRNINENISKINNVHLYGIDDMLSIVDETITNRKEAIEHAKEIIQNMIGELHDWLNSQSLNPLIKQVKNFHSLHKSDLNTFIKSLPESSINTDVLNNFALFLNKKYANRVINNIKEITENGKQIEYINVINKIFETKSHD